MITLVRSAKVQEGAAMEAALEWAVKMAKYLAENYGTDTQVQINVGGALNQVHWVSTTENLAQLDEISRKTQADEVYASLIAEARERGLFVGSSLVDRIFRSVS